MRLFSASRFRMTVKRQSGTALMTLPPTRGSPMPPVILSASARKISCPLRDLLFGHGKRCRQGKKPLTNTPGKPVASPFKHSHRRTNIKTYQNHTLRHQNQHSSLCMICEEDEKTGKGWKAASGAGRKKARAALLSALLCLCLYLSFCSIHRRQPGC